MTASDDMRRGSSRLSAKRDNARRRHPQDCPCASCELRPAQMVFDPRVPFGFREMQADEAWSFEVGE